MHNYIVQCILSRDNLKLGHISLLTDMKVCLSRTGSSDGSSVSPTSSHKTGIPIRIQFSNVRKNWPSVNLIILNPF